MFLRCDLNRAVSRFPDPLFSNLYSHELGDFLFVFFLLPSLPPLLLPFSFSSFLPLFFFLTESEDKE